MPFTIGSSVPNEIGQGVHMWFDSWFALWRIVLVGTAAYFSLVALLRITGKRTLSQLNAFDFVVTVAMGSILATILLSADTSWAEGATSLVVLTSLQFVVASICMRWPWARRVVTSEPAIVFAHGKIRHDVLRRHRLTDSEVRQAVRMQGNGDLSTVAAVVLETNGTLSVIAADKYGDGSALADLTDVN